MTPKRFKELQELKSFRKVGERFTYLGIQHTTQKHFATPSCSGLNAIYEDFNGTNRISTFVYSDLPYLRTENQ